MAADLLVIVTTEQPESPLGGGLPVISAGPWFPASLRGVPSGDDGTAAEGERLLALPLKIMGGSDAVIREPAPPTGQVPRMVTAAVLGLLVVVTVVTRLHTYGEPLERDLATYAVIAHELSDGRRLYSDLWDHKPPVTHLTYAAAQALAGVGPGSVYLLGVLTALATLLGVFWAGRTRRPGAVTGRSELSQEQFYQPHPRLRRGRNGGGRSVALPDPHAPRCLSMGSHRMSSRWLAWAAQP
jgi:hypothetical protein